MLLNNPKNKIRFFLLAKNIIVADNAKDPIIVKKIIFF